MKSILSLIACCLLILICCGFSSQRCGHYQVICLDGQFSRGACDADIYHPDHLTLMRYDTTTGAIEIITVDNGESRITCTIKGSE
jgi:hypothetical protein